MGKSLRSRISLFRFSGTRFTAFLRESVLEAHNQALRHMLEYLVENTPNFTGETQATFRQFRDYLSRQTISVDLNDFTEPVVLDRKHTWPKGWNIPAKIANLPNAGNETAYGAPSHFSCVIDRQKFAITVNFETGSVAFDLNPDMQNVIQGAKDAYKEFFKGALNVIFGEPNFSGSLKSFFFRVDIGST